MAPHGLQGTTSSFEEETPGAIVSAGESKASEHYSLKLTLICQVKEFSDQYPVQHEIRKRILARFRRENIRFPVPVQTVRVTRNDSE